MTFYKQLDLPLDETLPQDVSTHLETMSAQQLSEVRLRDLHALSQYGHHHGLYFFYQENQLMYIGTCRSRTFFNRVVCHLDAYEHAWMNTLLRKVKDSQNVSLQEAATIVFEHFSVKFVSVPMFDKGDNERKSQLLHLENALRAELQPKLNAAKSISPEICIILRCWTQKLPWMIKNRNWRCKKSWMCKVKKEFSWSM